MVVVSVIMYPMLKGYLYRKILNIYSTHFISDHSACVTILINGFVIQLSMVGNHQDKEHGHGMRP
jgi:hypothetical protein